MAQTGRLMGNRIVPPKGRKHGFPVRRQCAVGVGARPRVAFRPCRRLAGQLVHGEAHLALAQGVLRILELEMNTAMQRIRGKRSSTTAVRAGHS